MEDTAATAPADLSQFDEANRRQNEGIAVPIMSMDGRTPLGFSIRVAGPDSDTATRAREEMADAMIDAGGNPVLNARERARRGIEYLARVTLGWEPRVILDGGELEFSRENAERLYQRFPFIREQVDAAAGSRARFLKG